MAAGAENRMREPGGEQERLPGESSPGKGSTAADGALHLGMRMLLLEKWREECEHLLEAQGIRQDSPDGLGLTRRNLNWVCAGRTWEYHFVTVFTLKSCNLVKQELCALD